MPAETRGVNTTLLRTSTAPDHTITRLQYRGWVVDVDSHEVSVPRQVITTQHLADLQVILAAAHSMRRPTTKPAAASTPRPTPADVLVTLLEDARAIAADKWNPSTFDLYVCTRTAWLQTAWDVPYTDVLHALRRGLAPDTNLTEFSDRARGRADITALYTTAITALASATADTRGAA